MVCPKILDWSNPVLVLCTEYFYISFFQDIPQVYASALYLFGSRLNHSCFPSAEIQFNGPTLDGNTNPYHSHQWQS